MKRKRKETYLSRYYRRMSEFVELWNSNPDFETFNNYLMGKVGHPYHLYFMVKYPEGNIPPIKIRYRKRK